MTAERKVPKKKAGSSSKYEEWAKYNIDKIKEMVYNGMSIKSISDQVGINQSTFYVWRRKYPALDLAIREAKMTGCAELEESVIKRGLGYEVQNEEITDVLDGEGNLVKRTIKRSVNHIPADIKAAEMMLNRMDPDKYSKKADVTVELPGVLVVPATSESWEDQVKAQQKQLQKDAIAKADAALGK